MLLKIEQNNRGTVKEVPFLLNLALIYCHIPFNIVLNPSEIYRQASFICSVLYSLSSLSFPPLSFFYLLLPAEDKSGSGKDHDNGRTSSSPPLRLQLCRLPWQQSRQTGRVVGSPTKSFIFSVHFFGQDTVDDVT